MGDKGSKLFRALDENKPEIVLENKTLLNKLDLDVLKRLLNEASHKNNLKVVELLLTLTGNSSTRRLAFDALKNQNLELLNLYFSKDYFSRVMDIIIFSSTREHSLNEFDSDDSSLTSKQRKIKINCFKTLLRHSIGKQYPFLYGSKLYTGHRTMFYKSWSQHSFIFKRGISFEPHEILQLNEFLQLQILYKDIPIIYHILVNTQSLSAVKIIEENFKHKFWNKTIREESEKEKELLIFYLSVSKQILRRLKVSKNIKLLQN